MSYVFKSLRISATIAFQMDIDSTTSNPLQQEVVFFDAMHSCVKGYKTLTLWVHNPILVKLQWLATMEAPRENTESIEMFWKLFNQCLQIVSKDPTYKFNPCKFMFDEGGANFIGLENVFGEEVLRCVITCQWHFLQCV